MFRKTRYASDDLAAIQNLLGDLQVRLRRLNGNVRQEVAGTAEEVGDYLAKFLGRASQRAQRAAADTGETVGREAARLGSQARKRIQRAGHDIKGSAGQRPVLALAFAVGIGFLLGMAARR